jgi:hypothetical protein
MGAQPILTDHAQEGYQTNEMFDATMRQAKEQGQPFIVAWRQLSNTEYRLFESDASCGCGPID